MSDEGTAKRIAPTMPAYAERHRAWTETNKNLYYPVHEFIEETRQEWKDTFSFGRWLGACEGFSIHELHVVRGSVRDGKARFPARLFFHKLREAKKSRRKQ
jgi:hypothetical protein